MFVLPFASDMLPESQANLKTDLAVLGQRRIAQEAQPVAEQPNL